MVNSPLIRPYFLGGVPLGSHDINLVAPDTSPYSELLSPPPQNCPGTPHCGARGVSRSQKTTQTSFAFSEIQRDVAFLVWHVIAGLLKMMLLFLMSSLSVLRDHCYVPFTATLHQAAWGHYGIHMVCPEKR